MDLNSHKRALSIIHIVIGSLTVITVLFFTIFFNSIFPFVLEGIAREEGREAAGIVEMASTIVRSIFLLIILLVTLPSIIGGIAVLNKQKWGMVLLMISGCISLLSFPIGTAKGVYTIWVFVEDNKIENDQDKQ